MSRSKSARWLLTRLPPLLLVSLLPGCAPPAQRPADANVTRQVTAEIGRICGLPSAARAAEIERVRAAEGMAIICPGAY